MTLFSVVTQSDRCIKREPFVGAGSIRLATDRVAYESAGEGDGIRERGACGRQGQGSFSELFVGAARWLQGKGEESVETQWITEESCGEKIDAIGSHLCINVNPYYSGPDHL